MQVTQPTEQAESENDQGQPIHVWRPYPQFTDEERTRILANDPVEVQNLVSFIQSTLEDPPG
jgi:hypothetical protein